MEGQLEFGNKWNKIAAKLPGRCENSVKNRYNILYKKNGIFHKAKGAKDINQALNGVNEIKKNDNDWITKLIKEKRRLLCIPESVPEPPKVKTPPLKLKSLRQSLVAMAKLELPETQNDSTCFNYRYLNRMKNKTAEIISDSERFVNPNTGQEIGRAHV